MKWKDIYEIIEFWCLTLSIQSEHGLNCHINAMKLILLKHDLCDLLPVFRGVHGWLSQQDLREN